jgi:hypothetical protein
MQTEKDRLAESAAALQRKAAIYERMAAGLEDDEEEKYNVDFFAKAGTLEDEAVRMARDAGAATVSSLDPSVDTSASHGGASS